MLSSWEDNTDRLVDFLLRQGAPVSERVLLNELGWSRSTFFRALRKTRAQGVQILCKSSCGYWIESPVSGKSHSLQKNIPEILRSVGSIIQLGEVEAVQSGLQSEWEEFRILLWKLFLKQKIELNQVAEKVRVLPQHRRKIDSNVFTVVSDALFSENVLLFHYQDSKGRRQVRIVSPQRLVMYRNGWSLDGFCHDKKLVRQFILDRIYNPRIKNDIAWQEVDAQDLNRILSSGYGLFAGEAVNYARICFKGIAARYVEREQWHPNQVITKEGDKLYMTLPYSAPNELLGDVLRWGSMAEVESPPELVAEYRKIVEEMAGRWRNGTSVKD